MISTSSLGIVGSSFSLGQYKDGVEYGPSCIRNNGLRDVLQQNYFNIFDYGDFHQNFPKEALWESTGGIEYFLGLKRKLLNSLRENDFSIHLGGDHSVAISSIAAVKTLYPDAIILWVDAHGDINTKSQSATGALHGMPLAALLGIQTEAEDESWWNYTEQFQCLKAEDLVYLGIRDLDSAELQNLKKLGIRSFSAGDMQSLDFEENFSRLWKSINPEGSRPVYISFDIDSVDPNIAPATGVPVPDGIGTKELKRLFNLLEGKSQLVGFDLVELNPELVTNKAELLQSLSVIYYFVELAMRLQKGSPKLIPNKTHSFKSILPLFS